MSISDFLSQTADLYYRTTEYTAGLEAYPNTPSLRASGVPCLAVQESPSMHRIFFDSGQSVWEDGDTEVRIAIGSAVYVIHPGSFNPVVGLEYGEIDWHSYLSGSHVEVIAEREVIA